VNPSAIRRRGFRPAGNWVVKSPDRLRLSHKVNSKSLAFSRLNMFALPDRRISFGLLSVALLIRSAALWGRATAEQNDSSQENNPVSVMIPGEPTSDSAQSGAALASDGERSPAQTSRQFPDPVNGLGSSGYQEGEWVFAPIPLKSRDWRRAAVCGFTCVPDQ